MNRTSVPCTRYLEDGGRLRIRMPRATDRERLAALVGRTALRTDALEAARMLRFDPQRRAVLVAGLWTGTTSIIVGYAATDRGAQRPDLVLTDEELAPGVTAELCHVLTLHAAARAHRAA